MVTKGEKNTKKPGQQKSYSNEDIYLKLKSIEKKIKSVENDIDSSKRIQIRIGFFALGAAVVFLSLSYYLAFLQSTDKDTTTFYLWNIPALLAIGAFAIFYASTFKPKSLKMPKMTKEQEETRKLERSTAEEHSSLSLGLFSSVLLGYSILVAPNSEAALTDNLLWFITSLIVVLIGVLSMLSAIYLFLPLKCKQKEFFGKMTRWLTTKMRIRHIILFLGLVFFGLSLIQTIQTDWAAILGQICIYTGYAVLIIGGIKAVKEITNGN